MEYTWKEEDLDICSQLVDVYYHLMQLVHELRKPGRSVGCRFLKRFLETPVMGDFECPSVSVLKTLDVLPLLTFIQGNSFHLLYDHNDTCPRKDISLYNKIIWTIPPSSE